MKDDPRALEARQRLGLDDAAWDALVAELEAIPHWHAKGTAETEPERVRRRARMAERMRELAAELEADPDLGRLIPIARDGAPPVLLEARPTETLPTLGGWLEGVADELEARPISRGPLEPVETRKGASVRAFAIHETHRLLEQYAPGRRARNLECALLVSALLGEGVTSNDVTQARRAERRRYWRD